ncbi:MULTISPECIES: heavy metal translocating P-type ATPase [Butyricimonas]|jgi:copper-exporting ATPase|uniref:Cu2+-exporting ATPase n=4 Tax=Butyricimonas faecihominis TaxID=1472416 RepID=A0A7W6MXC8_9BACT|nr:MULTISPECIES: heavy metal translocating P-type ATPase [Butyricimonas]MBB4024726.1 Cu2+-exporting ATPase [Butyricimonas faecihominis]MBS6688578.1 copper-translocating P-type ATPase [Sanguibacteroides justesenii]BEI55572.1 heavy metal translocating P-type ATPase [Butyricimonas faecihominis]GGJ17501.1 copper-translocating P-type ATPase [Butyricimonas faecihominis]
MSGKEIHTKETFQVLGMSCAVCALNVETTLGAQEGVYEAKVNFAGSTVLVDYNPQVITPVELQKAVEAAGYELVVENTEDTDQADRLQREEFLALKRKTIGAIVLAIPVFVIGMFFMHMPYGNWIMLAFTIPVMAFFGRDFFVHAYMQLKHGRANMDTLVAVSTGVAFLFSLFNTIWPEYWTSRGLEAHVYYEAAAVIIALILLGRLLEAKAKFSTSTAIKKLMGLQPKTVTKILADGSEEEVPIREVAVGDVLVVKPGEKIPVDGEVTEGASFVDESMITGESIPVEKVKGQPVYAGTINEKGSFRFRADKVGGETVLANIIRMVQEAQGSKAPVQKLVDRIAGIFVPVVMGIAVITFIVWMLIGGDLAFTHALLTSITVLVIACPCALGLATPTAIMVGIGKGAEHNILIKDAESLELMYRVNAIVLDKTGTITEGKPVVTDIHWTPGAEDERYQSILLEIERRSEHPLADAVVQKFKEKVVNEISVSDFENQTGKGVTAKVGDKVYLVGNRALMDVNHVVLDDDNEKLAVRWEGDGKTVVFFAGEGRVLALVAIADKIKESSRQAIATLHEKGIDVYMLTGDNALTARAVADQVGIRHFKAEVMPGEKANFVEALQHEGKVVAMVGDGINDSQALAQADVSIAMGKGSDIAMDVAKVTLITSDLNVIPRAIALSHQTVRAIRQNLFWAFIYNIIGIPLAAGVLYGINGFLLNPMIAAAAMAFSSVSVVTNSLRIKWKKL